METEFGPVNYLEHVAVLHFAISKETHLFGSNRIQIILRRICEGIRGVRVSGYGRCRGVFSVWGQDRNALISHRSFRKVGFGTWRGDSGYRGCHSEFLGKRFSGVFPFDGNNPLLAQLWNSTDGNSGYPRSLISVRSIDAGVQRLLGLAHGIFHRSGNTIVSAYDSVSLIAAAHHLTPLHDDGTCTNESSERDDAGQENHHEVVEIHRPYPSLKSLPFRFWWLLGAGACTTSLWIGACFYCFFSFGDQRRWGWGWGWGWGSLLLACLLLAVSFLLILHALTILDT
jgi:hypothetical protein